MIDQIIKKKMVTLLITSLISMNLTVPGQAAGSMGGNIPVDLKASASDWSLATDSVTKTRRTVSTGDLWEHWTATDFKFLDGARGKGTKTQPYQIQTKAHLRALSQLASLGMTIVPGALESDQYVGDYEGNYFELMGDLNLGGMEWIPIGFYQNQAELVGEVPHPFRGHFNGNGYTISNYKISQPTWNHVGLFGAVEDSTIWNLNVQISDTLSGRSHVGIVAGSVIGLSKIINCSGKGTIRGRGLIGGLVGYFAGDSKDTSIIEDCKANVTLDSQMSDNGSVVSVGGIVGQADRVTIVDCQVETANNTGARIQGKGYVGGIVGWQNDTDLYNVFVSSGTIGGNGSTAIGGITGYYTAGDIKVGRMNGTIGSSGLGNYAHEGIFIGNKGSGCNFTYGLAQEDDMAYLFTDTEAKLNIGACGSDVPDDNGYTFQDHVGFWHTGDLYYTLKQGSRIKVDTEQYFYEELEQGILGILDYEINGGNVPFQINHFAPDSTGRPKRGYLIRIPQIDTVANGAYFYDVAVLTLKGGGTYDSLMDKDRRGAVAEGTIVTVATSPKNTNTEKYQMEGAPFYNKNGKSVETVYVAGGQYTFSMPANDTEVWAVYKRVAADVKVSPTEYSFKVIQTRTGSRKAPTLTTVVTGNNGSEIARYVNGRLDGAQVMPVSIQKTVDANNDVADSRVLWSVDNQGLINLLRNDDEDRDGYTDKSASVQVKLDSAFFTDIIKKQEAIQEESGYRYAIPPTIYGAGHAGEGIGILTASTRKSQSFEGKPCTAQSRIKVTFQILDQTYVDVERVNLSQNFLDFTVTRILTGSGKSPMEQMLVTPPKGVEVSCYPEYFSKHHVNWEIGEPGIATILADSEGDKQVRVSANGHGKWIRDIIEIDNVIKMNQPYEKINGNGRKETQLTVIVTDKNGIQRTADATIRVSFFTEDKTGGGSSGGSGGGGGSSKGVVTDAPVSSAATLPNYVVNGTWIQNASGKWMFTHDARRFASEWAAIYNPYANVIGGQRLFDWFRLDEEGFLLTGWFKDQDGNLYYLNPASDGTQGRMVTGWNVIDGVSYYFKEESDGTQGSLVSQIQ